MRILTEAVALVIIFIFFVNAIKYKNNARCKVIALVESGWVCGSVRKAEYNSVYASFRGIPYAEQPVGELRFRELQPAKPWPIPLDATEDGPVCPQDDVFYRNLVRPNKKMSESCIHANVHVPIDALPKVEVNESIEIGDENVTYRIIESKASKPILVFIHGGGWCYGSGDADLYGPEYLVSKGFIVITFNYRLNVFGFLFYNSPKLPGNTGLRDQLTLLQWVQRNARSFGGNPSDITLIGQSNGAVSVHLLALSEQAKGLFNRIILMSGTAVPAFYTTSQVYAMDIANKFLKAAGINSTDPDVVYNELIKMPLGKIMGANSVLLKEIVTGFETFSPVLENKYPGVTTIIDDSPINMIIQGRDRQYPTIVGFTNNECEIFRKGFTDINILDRIKKNPTIVLAAEIGYTTLPKVAQYLASKVIEKYFRGKLNIDDYLSLCKHTLFEYPAFQLVRWRAESNAAPTFLYQFTYDTQHSVLKNTFHERYKGNAHLEDLVNIFRENKVNGKQTFPPITRDDYMKDWMTDFIVNFMQCNDPSCLRGWPAVDPFRLNYQSVYLPGLYNDTCPTPNEMDTIRFHDEIHRIAKDPL